jgi:hypothetical protein
MDRLRHRKAVAKTHICRLQLATRRSEQSEVGERLAAKENIEVHRNAFEAQHVISVRWDFNLELRRLFHAIRAYGSLGLRSVLIQFQAELETKLVELILGVFFAQRLVEIRFVHSDCRHLGQQCLSSEMERGMLPL